MTDTVINADQPGRQLPGTLFLLPAPLGGNDEPTRVLPTSTVEAVRHVDYVIAENARSARAVLGKLGLRHSLQSIEIRELNQRTNPLELPQLLTPILAGKDAALLSEAGCPAVADPGAALVELAHQHDIRVVPLIGPSAILLALMASGMNGQRFAFSGYVPVAADERTKRLRELEERSLRENETQLLIETPYRNQALLDAMLQTLNPETRLTLASDLTLPGELITAGTVAQWRSRSIDLPRTPTVFAFLAQPARQNNQYKPKPRPGATKTRSARR